MITNDGYSITQYVNQNKIVITLPQTTHTLMNTVTPVAQRRVELSDNELTAILVAVKAMYEVSE